MDEKNPDGITAYHGSPHEFEQFDTSKIGTGVGEQAYGHGIYFTESEPVAEEYRDSTTKSKNLRDFTKHRLLDFGGEFEPQMKGHMYEVHIDAHPDHFLDWDNSITKDHPLAAKLDALHHELMEKNNTLREHDPSYYGYTGNRYYKDLADVIGRENASKRLQEIGVPGIRYLDAGSRGAEENPTHNYVVFDHDRVNIKRRYAEGGEVEGYKKGGIIHDETERDINLGHFLYQSKVRNSDGDHVVLYHITPKDFDTFKPGGNDPRLSGPAIWLSPNKNYLPAAHNVGGMGNYDKGTNVMPVYANIKSPLVIDTPEMHEWAKKVYKSPELPYLLHPEAKQMMMDDGYDGIFYGLGKGSVEYGTNDVGIGQQPHGEEEIIAFHPHQIKSATGNNGNFDPNDPDITKAEGGVIAKHPAKLHNPAIIEHALGKVGAPPPAFGQTLSVAKRGRPL